MDTSKGIIPKGFDLASLDVTSEGAGGSAAIAFLCQYPPPTVVIANPAQDITIELSSSNQPVIPLSEEHTPTEGQFVPSITWDSSNVIDTKDYYGQIQDSLVLTVKVTAENDGGTATDTRKITLKKKGCEDGPQCPETQMLPPLISFEIHESAFGGYDPCAKKAPGRISLGEFALVPGKNILVPFQVEPCFGQSTNTWKFPLSEIKLNAVQAICYANINANNQILINSCDEIPHVDAQRAIRDLKLQLNYGFQDPNDPAYRVRYLSAQGILWHEEAHKRDFLNIFLSLRNQWEQLFNSIKPPCEQFSSLEEAAQQGHQLILNKLFELYEKFLKEFSRKYFDQSKVDPSSSNFDPVELARMDKYEHDTQKNTIVQQFIYGLIEQIPCN